MIEFIKERNLAWARDLLTSKKNRGRMSDGVERCCCLGVAAVRAGKTIESLNGHTYPDSQVEEYYGWPSFNPIVMFQEGECFHSETIKFDQLNDGPPESMKKWLTLSELGVPSTGLTHPQISKVVEAWIENEMKAFNKEEFTALMRPILAGDSDGND